jgi:hypothetical protein
MIENLYYRYNIKLSNGHTFLLKRKVSKEIAFLPAVETIVYVDNMIVLSQQPIPCYPALRDQAYPIGRNAQRINDDGSKKACHPRIAFSS